ncbi:hypothetical protein C8T65DRAFT_711088 [Cerioporus squamosus]|nr:hypothetical protein C8T65DRAFT_711088 [Cerioporus squamosus]
MPSQVLVDDLPLEIWQQIFTHACTDGGCTGTSLALVNKFFHRASHPTRFRSLSFSSLVQIEGFLTYVAVYQHDSKLRILHLLLSFPNAMPPETSSQDDVGPSQSLNVWYIMRQQREHEKAAWDRRFLHLIPSLLQLAAPHLETLALLQSDGFAIPTIRTVLPRLRELTLLVGISVTLSEGAYEHEPSSAQTLSFSPTTVSATSSLGNCPHGTRFPALERLHLVCGRHRDWTLREPLSYLMRLAPALTHLRISNATYTHGQDGSIPAFLRDALGMPSALPGSSALLQCPPGSEVAHAAGMPGLQHVVLHSVPPPDGGRCGNTHKDYRALVGAVQAIADACESSEDVRVRWVEGERMRGTDWGQVIRAQWMDRITGGCGCWEDDELGNLCTSGCECVDQVHPRVL